MNLSRIIVVLAAGIFASQASAGGLQEEARPPVGVVEIVKESIVIQAIRMRLADSCNTNSDCAFPVVPGNDSMAVAQGQRSGPLSTPELKRGVTALPR